MSNLPWHDMFWLSRPWLELVIRGSVTYWALVLMFRIVLRREIGALGISDMLLLVLIADAAQNAMAGEYRSITDGLILVSTLIAWNFLFDLLSYHYPPMRRLLEPRALVLVRDGRIMHRNLRREFITEAELLGKLRNRGIAELAEVRIAILENDGNISVIRTDRQAVDAPAGPPVP